MKKKKEINLVFSEQQFVVKNRYFLLLARSNDLNTSRIAVSVSKKRYSKLAVKRNRLKRLVKYSFIKNLTNYSLDIVCLTRNQAKDLPDIEIVVYMDALWEELILKSQKKLTL